MQKLSGLIKFALSNFGPIGIFYLANQFWGLQLAVAATVAWSIGEITIYKLRGIPIGTFFLFSAGITITFGFIDIYLQQAVLFKYEAAMTNVLVGAYFAASLFGKKTLIQEFAEAQGRVTNEITADTLYYFRFLTAVWVGYLFLKAGAYAWIAANYSLEQALVIRGTFGNVSFYGLLFLSIFCSKQIKSGLAKCKFLPSSRNS